MREVAVVGVGMTKIGVLDKTSTEMFSEAAMEAIKESNLESRDIQALFLGNAGGQREEGQGIMASFAADEIGIAGVPATRFEGACSSGTMAFRDAFIWVASGYYDIVLAAGVERQTMLSTPFITSIMTGGVNAYYEAPTGITFPGIFAMLTHLYSRKYGVSLAELKECMAMVAIKAHKNGSLNPKAHFQKEVTKEQVLNSFMVAQPLQLFDCCPVSDGAAAAVLTSAEVAQKLVKKPIYIAGIGQSSSGSLISQKDLPRVKAREISAKQAYHSSGLTPKDIDVCELHDCFTIAEILAIEGLGFFDHGEGYMAVKKGETQIKGKIAINPSGGLKARGHPVGGTGLAQIYEITKQLRGECGTRQVEGAKIGMTDTLGGDLCSVVNIILRG